MAVYLVIPGLVPGIHVLTAHGKEWMAGTSPAMTKKNKSAGLPAWALPSHIEHCDGTDR